MEARGWDPPGNVDADALLVVPGLLTDLELEQVGAALDVVQPRFKQRRLCILQLLHLVRCVADDQLGLILCPNTNSQAQHTVLSQAIYIQKKESLGEHMKAAYRSTGM